MLTSGGKTLSSSGTVPLKPKSGLNGPAASRVVRSPLPDSTSCRILSNMNICLTPSEWIQLGSLTVAAVGLVFLIKYVRYTNVIAEATFKPAIIAIHEGVITKPPELRNVGNGPALEVKWEMPQAKKKGEISCIEPRKDSKEPYFLDSIDLQKLEPAAVVEGTNKRTIECSYKSISGKTYRCSAEYDYTRNQFTTTFRN
ncbi:MAG: hypothetical protein WB421_19455 [Terriglobales bacterium]